VNSRKKKGTRDTYYGFKKLINTVKVKRVKFLFLSTPLRHVGGKEVYLHSFVALARDGVEG